METDHFHWYDRLWFAKDLQCIFYPPWFIKSYSVLWLFPFDRWENWCAEKLRNLLMAVEPVNCWAFCRNLMLSPFLLCCPLSQSYTTGTILATSTYPTAMYLGLFFFSINLHFWIKFYLIECILKGNIKHHIWKISTVCDKELMNKKIQTNRNKTIK